MLSPRKTLGAAVDEVLYELGDAPGGDIWSRERLLQYGQEGYRDFCRNSGIQWGVDFLPDLPRVANYTQQWERDVVPSGHILYERFNCSNKDEAEFNEDVTEPAQCTAPWEVEFLASLGAANVQPIPATAALPVDARDVVRVSNDRRAISPMRRSELQKGDYRYKETRGPVVAFSLDGDGLKTLRKYRVPSVASEFYEVNVGAFGLLRASGGTPVSVTTTTATGGMRIDEFKRTATGELTAADRERIVSVGFSHRTAASTITEITQGPMPLTDLSAFAGTIIGSGFGILRRAPGFIPCGMKGRAGFGGIRRIYSWRRSTRVEFWGVGEDPDVRGNLRIELPRCYSHYVSHYIKYKAYDQEGPGHDEVLAALYLRRYELGVQRAAARRSITKKDHVAGSGGEHGTTSRPPRPQLPWQYGPRRNR